MCTPETDGELCTARGQECGGFEAVDRCGKARQVVCSGCALPARCGGGGEVNRCAAHPSLIGIDGYILQEGSLGGRFHVNFANDGVATAGGFCCADTIEEARAAYPGKNMIVLPGQSRVTAGEVPSFRRVDGYIVPSRPGDAGPLRIELAIDGALTGEGTCCFESIDAARAAHPDKNLGYLPEFPN